MIIQGIGPTDAVEGNTYNRNGYSLENQEQHFTVASEI